MGNRGYEHKADCSPHCNLSRLQHSHLQIKLLAQHQKDTARGADWDSLPSSPSSPEASSFLPSLLLRSCLASLRVQAAPIKKALLLESTRYDWF